MKFTAIAIAAASLAAIASSAAASNRVSDVDFLRANRCKGIATSLTGVVDGAALNNFVKATRGARDPMVYDRAEAEFDRAKREARNGARKEKLTAELTGPCSAYLGDPASFAKR